MGAQLGTSGTISDINMTPLIDIVLVVLIIMMVNIPIQVEEMGVKLPSTVTNNPPPSEKTEQLVIALYEDDRVAVIANDGSIFPGDPVVKTGAFALGLALQVGSGAVDPHAGHNH